jgi:hypothetical protein
LVRGTAEPREDVQGGGRRDESLDLLTIRVVGIAITLFVFVYSSNHLNHFLLCHFLVLLHFRPGGPSYLLYSSQPFKKPSRNRRNRALRFI